MVCMQDEHRFPPVNAGHEKAVLLAGFKDLCAVHTIVYDSIVYRFSKCAIQFASFSCRFVDTVIGVKEKENKPTKRAYGLGMKAQMFRFPPLLIERLTRAATKAKLSKSGYVVRALERELKKDGIH